MSVIQKLSKVALLLASCSLAPTRSQDLYSPEELEQPEMRRLASSKSSGRRRRRRSEPVEERSLPGRRRGPATVSDGRRRRGEEVEEKDDYGRRRRRRSTSESSGSLTSSSPRRRVSSKRESGQTVVEYHGKLQVKDGYIVNQHGDAIQLTGVSLFWSQWSDYWTSGVVEWLADDFKVGVVRAAMGVTRSQGYLDDSHRDNKRDNIEKLEEVVDEAIKQGIYVIIDWHIVGSDALRSSVMREAKDFFKDMGRKYGQYDNVLWETFNEPHRDTDWEDEIKPYHEELIPLIRKYSDGIIMLGSQSWSQDVDEAAKDPVFHRNSKYGHNLVYSLHVYAINHQEKYRRKAIKAIERGVTLFANEWGVCAHYGGRPSEVDWDEVEEWIDLFDKYKIGNTHWSVNDNEDEGCSLLKERTSDKGGWSRSDLTKTGRFIRDYTRKYEI